MACISPVMRSVAGRVGSGQEVFKILRVRSGPVVRCCTIARRVGSGRVGSGGFGISRVGSGRVGSGRVGSGPVGSQTWPVKTPETIKKNISLLTRRCKKGASCGGGGRCEYSNAPSTVMAEKVTVRAQTAWTLYGGSS